MERPELGYSGPAAVSKKRLAVLAAQQLERVGVHVLPAHFYSSLPDRRALRADRGWRHRAGLGHLAWDLDDQVAWLRARCEPFLDEVAGFSFLSVVEDRGIPFRYGLIEAQVLHGVVRSMRPQRILEIGSGASTAIMAGALARNAEDGGPISRLTAIDPFATEAVMGLQGVDVRQQSAADMADDLISDLGSGDLLFIDSSHAVKTGSELAHLYLDVLPRISSGVTVHIHDIYLPYLYSPWVLEELWDWQETTLLLALLTGSSLLSVACSLSGLHHDRTDELRSILPDYRPLAMDHGLHRPGAVGHFPSSTWLTAG